MKGSSLFHSRSPSPSHHRESPPSPTRHHTFSDSMIDENLDFAESVVRHWDLDANRGHYTPLFSTNNTDEPSKFLEAVADLQKAMHHYVGHHHGSANHRQQLIRAQNLMQIAIKRLEKEFHVILSANKKNLDSESISNHSSVYSTGEEGMEEDDEQMGFPIGRRTPPRTTPRGGGGGGETASDKAMADLKSIADAMISCGYARECVNIYRVIRKSMVDEALYHLGVEKGNNNHHSQIHKMEWDVLEPKIKGWLRAVKFAVKTLFHGERILCDAVFSSSERIAESCFTDIARDAALSMFTFPENLAKSKKILSPEKIFRALDMYEALSNLWPEIESIFSHQSTMEVRKEALTAQVKLGDAVRVMLTQFEAAIQKDSSKVTSGGNVHPLTRYVMNFLVFLGDYTGAVAEIVADWTESQTPLPASYFWSPTSLDASTSPSASIAERFVWLILVLLCKLDGKATQCDDVALSYLFLANNLNYVVSKVRSSNLALVLGGDWLSNNQSKVRRFLANFERMSWGKVMASLPEDPTAEISPENLDRFYKGFEEVYKKQSSWVVPDPKLRDEVKVSLSRKIVSGYRVFYERVRVSGSTSAIVRYAPEDFDNYLSDLFFAEGVSNTTSYEHFSGTSTSRGH